MENKNSGVATPTSQANNTVPSERLQQLIRKAVELQNELSKLSDAISEENDLDLEFTRASDRLQTLIHTDLSPMLGYLFINEQWTKVEEAV